MVTDRDGETWRHRETEKERERTDRTREREGESNEVFCCRLCGRFRFRCSEYNLTAATNETMQLGCERKRDREGERKKQREKKRGKRGCEQMSKRSDPKQKLLISVQ